MTHLNRIEHLPPYRKQLNAIKQRDHKLQWIAVIIPVVANIMVNRLTFGTTSIPTLFINKSYLKNPIKIELQAYAKLFSAFLLTFALLPFGPIFALLWFVVTDLLICRLLAYTLYTAFKIFEENKAAQDNLCYLINKLPHCISKYA